MRRTRPGFGDCTSRVIAEGRLRASGVRVDVAARVDERVQILELFLLFSVDPKRVCPSTRASSLNCRDEGYPCSPGTHIAQTREQNHEVSLASSFLASHSITCSRSTLRVKVVIRYFPSKKLSPQHNRTVHLRTVEKKVSALPGTALQWGLASFA